MATKIFTDYDLSSGSELSAEIASVGDLVLQSTVTGSTDNVEIKYIVKSKEGDGAYMPVRDQHGNEVVFQTRGNQSYRISIVGINSESVKVAVEVNGSTGTLNIESTKSANPLT